MLLRCLKSIIYNGFAELRIKKANFSWRAIIKFNINMIIMEKTIHPNELKISPEETKALMHCHPDVRYKYTIKRIADTETMWTLGIDSQTFAVQMVEGNYLLPIWSSKEFAAIFGSTHMKEYSCIPIILDDFEENIIDIIIERGYLLNVFPTQIEELGKVAGLNRFSEDLSEALSAYI